MPYSNALNLIFVRTPEAGAAVTPTLQTRKLRYKEKENIPSPSYSQQGVEMGFEPALSLPGQKFNHTPDQSHTGPHISPQELRGTFQLSKGPSNPKSTPIRLY